MLRNFAVKDNKNLAKEEKDIQADSIGHDFGKRLDLLTSRIEVSHSAYYEAQQDQQSRSGGKSRGEKTGGKDGGQPETAAGKATVQPGCYRVDADGERYRYIYKRFDPHGIMGVVALRFQHIPSYDDVEEQVTVENEGIPEEHRIRCGVKPHVEDPHRLSEIDENKKQAHYQ